MLHLRPFIFLIGILVLTHVTRIETQTTGTTPILYSLNEQNGLSDNVTTCFYKDNIGLADVIMHGEYEVKIEYRPKDDPGQE